MGKTNVDNANIVVQVKKAKTFWFVAAVLGVIALPTMIVSLVNDLWAIAIPAMVLVVFNFYGQPIAWTMLRKKVLLKNYYVAIAIDGVTSIKMLMSSFGRRESYVLAKVRTLISKGYLRGFVLDLEKKKLVRLDAEQETKEKLPEQKSVRTHCPSCGAAVVSNNQFCDYCSTKLA